MHKSPGCGGLDKVGNFIDPIEGHKLKSPPHVFPIMYRDDLGEL